MEAINKENTNMEITCNDKIHCCSLICKYDSIIVNYGNEVDDIIRESTEIIKCMINNDKKRSNEVLEVLDDILYLRRQYVNCRDKINVMKDVYIRHEKTFPDELFKLTNDLCMMLTDINKLADKYEVEDYKYYEKDNIYNCGNFIKAVVDMFKSLDDEDLELIQKIIASDISEQEKVDNFSFDDVYFLYRVRMLLFDQEDNEFDFNALTLLNKLFTTFDNKMNDFNAIMGNMEHDEWAKYVHLFGIDVKIIDKINNAFNLDIETIERLIEKSKEEEIDSDEDSQDQPPCNLPVKFDDKQMDDIKKELKDMITELFEDFSRQFMRVAITQGRSALKFEEQ